LHLLLPV